MDGGRHCLLRLTPPRPCLWAQLQEKHELNHERDVPLLVCPETIATNHRATICRVLYCSSPSRFVTGSENGVITSWNMKMGVQRTYNLDISSSKHLRVTDFALIPSAYRIAVSTTNR